MKAKDDAIGRWRSKNAIEQITAEAAQEVAQKIAAKEAQRSQEDIVTERADNLAIESVNTFLRMKNIKVTPTTFDEAVKMVYNLNRAEFNKWDKDDLVVLCAFQNALIATQKLSLELI